MKILKHSWLLLLPLLVQSCGGEEGADGDEDREGIKIEGNLNGGGGQKVTLWSFEEEGQLALDSTIVEDGKFEIWIPSNKMMQYAVQVGTMNTATAPQYNNIIYLFPDETTEKIEISATFPGVGDNYSIKGDIYSADFQTYVEFIRPIYGEIMGYRQQQQVAIDKNEKDLLANKMDSLQRTCKIYAIEYINEKPYSPVAWTMLQEMYPPSGLSNFDSTDLGYFEKVRDAMAEKYPYSVYPSYIDESIQATLAQLEKMKGGGDLAPDLAFQNPDGKTIKLSDLRGKIVLLDFWASWCMPCRMENPNVVRTYEKYKDQGFTVYSVSLDEDKQRWIDAIAKDNLSWPNHVSDLKGWYSDAASIYDVRSIPATFLIDREGRIVGQDLRGKDLEQRLQELL
ncbi:AhpC/TSA family protein [Paracrocinitomix mangrovi]|uniref:TlpA disulfide reductase family protein n=1 Tax=Paracrocinitomix mangrovi TaxID=2862509 RepID=UPI001EDB7FC9|nr:TlpA disulfide reductase family protein [Paracrocinitomix mangrovi]UKN02138.1 AhpC/TSA family protein [Paracrocinitomix mangrovi]